MSAWLESIAGPEYASALMWTIVALIALLVLLILIRIVRGLTFGTFVAGGRNRKARLAVMDATAVDSHRRLVLVRRDDVEHLILIGGPSDVVVEQNIRLLPPARRPASEDAPADIQQEPVLAPQPAPERPRPQPAPVRKPPPPVQPGAAPRPAAVAPSPVPAQPPQQTYAARAYPAPSTPSVEPSSSPAAPPANSSPPSVQPAFSSIRPPEPPRAATPFVPVPPVVSPRPVEPTFGSVVPRATPAPEEPVPDTGKHDLDDALLEELEVSLDKEHRGQDSSDADKALDEEMSRLLGDLSGERR